MPTNLVKSKRDEELWERAKEAARKAGLKEGTRSFYAYTVYVYKRLKQETQ